MKESAEMLEIRKIRDENSLRYLSQTPEEREREAKETMQWFIKRMGRDIKVVSLDSLQTLNTKAI